MNILEAAAAHTEEAFHRTAAALKGRGVSVSKLSDVQLARQAQMDSFQRMLRDIEVKHLDQDGVRRLGLLILEWQSDLDLNLGRLTHGENNNKLNPAQTRLHWNHASERSLIRLTFETRYESNFVCPTKVLS